jgi:hypothetical protein
MTEPDGDLASPPIGYNTLSDSGLPMIIGAPTARSKFLELQEDLDAYVSAYTEGSQKTDDPQQRAAIKHVLDMMAFLRPMMLKAYQLGIDDASFPTTLRFCPDCPKGKRMPLAKRKRYCPVHLSQRRRITYRLSKRSNRKTCPQFPQLILGVNNPMSEQEQKQKIVSLMREKELSLEKAAAETGVAKRQATHWLLYDSELYRAVTAARLVKYLGFILEADDLVRSGKEFNEGQKLYVETALWLRDFIAFLHPDEIGFMSPEMAERGRKAMKDLE